MGILAVRRDVDLDVLEKRLRRAEAANERDMGSVKSLATMGKAAQNDVSRRQELALACEKASVYMLSFADERLDEVHRRVETLVTHGLQTIFGREDLALVVRSETKASRLETSFYLRSEIDGQVMETSVLEAHGGGISAVVGFLLRLILALLTNKRPLLLLDESFSHVSAEYEPALAEFVSELAKRTDCQIILVTHSTAFEEFADTVYRLKLKDGRTHVEYVA